MSKANQQQRGAGGSAGGPNSLFDFDQNQNVQKSVGGDEEDANFASPTSSQFVHRDKKKGGKKKEAVGNSLHQLGKHAKPLNERVVGLTSQTHQETLEEALVDLYLSVKIRSNEEIDAYNEEILAEERERLRETNPFTILEYIKTSIEILMNMKMEEQQELREGSDKARKAKSSKNGKKPSSDTESFASGEEAPSEYESMLQKYEAEVRNHIKIEQQLKLHIECVQDKLEDQEKLLKKEVETNKKVTDESELELKRYKDLLSLREKEIYSLKKDHEQLKQYDESLKQRVDQLEKDKVDLSGQLAKKQRGASPFKVQSRSQYQMMDDLQDAMLAKGPIGEEDLRNNYNQYIAGSRTHKNGNSSKIMATTLPSQSVIGTHPTTKTGTSSLTNQTMYIFKSHGSTERVNSSSKNKQHLTDQKFKKEFIQKTKGQSDRAYLNRSAMSSGKPDANAITIPNGRSPDRSKNMSVYSQGQSLGGQVGHSHQGSSGGIGSTRSPYLGMTGNIGPGASNVIKKQRFEKAGGESGHRKKDSMLANATYKNAILSQNGSLASTQMKNLSGQGNSHVRTKSQNAGSVNLKLQSMQNYQQKIQENNQLIQSLSSNQHNQSQQMPQSAANFSLQQASEDSLDNNTALAAALQQQQKVYQSQAHHHQYMSQPQPGAPLHTQPEVVYNQAAQHIQQLSQSQIPTSGSQQPGQANAGQMMAHHGVQHIPTNIISGTYINSNIIVHHQKTKSSSNGPSAGRKHSAKHQMAQARDQQQQHLIAQRHLLNNTVNGHYPNTSNLSSALQGLLPQHHGQTPDLIESHHQKIGKNKRQQIPQHHQVNQVNTSNLISASGGHMRAGSYHVPDRSFHSTQQLNVQQQHNSAGAPKQSAYLSTQPQIMHTQSSSGHASKGISNTASKVQASHSERMGPNSRQRSLKHHQQ